MDALLLMAGAYVGYLLMYRFYGKFLADKIFNLDDSRPTPAVTQEDGVDFVPTKKEIIFGHHFTSIAGTGPIVGPAIAIIWGWVPALLWVFLGSILMGAVHDFGALVISLRNQGKSISEYTAKYINPRTKYFFFFIVFLELWIVVSIFGLVIAVLFKMYPSSVLPVWLEIPIAVALGWAVYKKGAGLLGWSLTALVVMYLTVLLGVWLPLSLPDSFLGISQIGLWTIILMVYAFWASVLPVTTLLQPRDFINSHQLVVAMVLLVVGVMAASAQGNLHIVAPAIQSQPNGAPSLWPFLFITIACGSISGFHALVSSGTSSKQIRRESDSLFVGYGSMLMEGALATLVIIAVAAGIGMGLTEHGQTFSGVQAWTHHYASWTAAKGLSSKVNAFVVGAANMMSAAGIPLPIGITIMGVFVASFAGTTLDSAVRIQRYILAEAFPGVFRNRFITTAVVIVLALVLVFNTGADGKGALKLWPLFGATNQILAALALIVITLYLKGKGGWKWIVTGIPALFMALMAGSAAIINQISFLKGNVLLSVLNFFIILTVFWIVSEGIIRFLKKE